MKVNQDLIVPLHILVHLTAIVDHASTLKLISDARNLAKNFTRNSSNGDEPDNSNETFPAPEAALEDASETEDDILWRGPRERSKPRGGAAVVAGLYSDAKSNIIGVSFALCIPEIVHALRDALLRCRISG